ncbi:MAG: hypothetical protein Q8J89_13135 [Caulobacter sp.]|nr:hypothetical protein [Caulobacter sp.]
MEKGKGMTRAEISGWIQVVLAIVGLYFTIKQAYPAIDALGQVGFGKGLPSNFQGSQGAIQVFLVVLVLMTLLMLLFVGLAVILGALFRQLDAKSPRHAAFSLVASVVLGAATFSLAMFGSLVWIPGALLSVLLMVGSGLAAVTSMEEEEGGLFWVLVIVGIPASVLFGIFIAALVAGPQDVPSNPEQEVSASSTK